MLKILGLTMCAGLLLACGSEVAETSRDGARFQVLEVPPNFTETRAFALSRDGRVVVGSGGPYDFMGTQSTEAVRWTPSGIDRLGIAGAATLVSGDGSVVVGDEAVSRFNFLWSETQGLMSFPLSDFDPWQFDVYGVSPDGRQFLVFAGNITGGAALLTGDAGRIILGDVHEVGSQRTARPTAMTPDGAHIVGWAWSGSGTTRAVRWDSRGAQSSLPTVGSDALDCKASALSDDGIVVVGHCIDSILEPDTPDAQTRAVRWEDGRGEFLPVLAGEQASQATTVSADGSTIIGNVVLNGSATAFYWTQSGDKQLLVDVLREAGLTDDLSGWIVTSVAGISADGRTLAGTGTDAGGRVRAFRAQLPQTPER